MAVALALAVAGCGKSGPVLYPVTGKVMLDYLRGASVTAAGFAAARDEAKRMMAVLGERLRAGMRG